MDTPSPPSYCASPLAYRRRLARRVCVGEVALGGTEPIRIQSMTTPATTDVPATVDQIERLVDAGCEIVRVTVPGRADAEALPLIRAEMSRRRLRAPLVADIHFSPAAALLAVEHVEKVRVNPGNYADRKRFEVHEYTDAEYADELERVRGRFVPLVDRARELGVALRVGTNQGSLSDRIVNRYGDSPEGMVESALEFVRICEERGHRDLVLSMKSSNTQVMIRAYRLLAARLAAEGGDYPFHLGVTEAGSGEEGRIKSAVGIGALLDDGLGDTVRVSLTEDPVAEIPVARRLVAPFRDRAPVERPPAAPVELCDPYGFERRRTWTVQWGPIRAGGDEAPRVEVSLAAAGSGSAELATRMGRLALGERPAEVVEIGAGDAATLRLILEALGTLSSGAGAVPAISVRLPASPPHLADLDGRELLRAQRLGLLLDEAEGGEALDTLLRSLGDGRVPLLLEVAVDGAGFIDPVERLVQAAGAVFRRGFEVAASLACSKGSPAVAAYRYLAGRLDALGLALPLVLRDAAGEEEDPVLDPARRLGGLLTDGLGDSVRLEGPVPAERARDRAYDILQAARRRTSRVEYVSCPSCGRTLFDLEEVTARIRSLTHHLKDVKIAIMGCIVNGPGEMADADFGYVGWGPGQVALFVGKECVEKDIPAAEAPERLVALIRRSGRWREPVGIRVEKADP